MSAAFSYQAPLPLFEEGLLFWEALTRESQHHARTINNVAAAHGIEAGELVEWKSGKGSIGIARPVYPSTDISLNLSFERWGPVIKVLVTGYEQEGLRFYTEEQEVPLACDLDGRTVAVLGEGRSYSPHEFGQYVVQHLRRCFPGVALPCTLGECA